MAEVRMNLNVSKKDPVAYGEYLLKCIAESNVSQTKLASKLGENRTELGRYVKIGKWGQNTKDFIINNRDKLTNTNIIKAARDFTDEEDALDFLKKSCIYSQKSKRGNHTETAENVTPIPNSHMLDSLINENQKLKSEVSSLKENITSLNREFESLRQCINPPTEKTISSKEEIDTQQKCINQNKKKSYLRLKGNNLKLNLMTAVFWLFVVPVTALFIEHCLNSFSIQKLPYLSSIPVTYLALTLAVAFDLLVFNLLNRNSRKSHVIGYLLIALNSAGAYFISSKNSQWHLVEEIKTEQNLVKSEISSLQEKVANKKAKYLSTKWPNSGNPVLCEEKKINCGLPYTSKAQDEFTAYLSSKELLSSKKDLLRDLKNQSIPRATSSDIYWHIGYYVIIWMLLLITLWLKRESPYRAYCTT